jgi:hypothetical protein
VYSIRHRFNKAQTGGYTLKRISIQILVLMLSLLAAGISSLLLQKHMTGKAGISLFEAGCEVGGDTGNVSCAKVLQSPYAVWPYLRGNEDAAAIRKTVPVAFLGLIYYLALAIWFIGVGLPDDCADLGVPDERRHVREAGGGHCRGLAQGDPADARR